MNSARGILLVISGPSGVGKSTVCRRLVDRLGAFLSVSATTRQPREGEVEGRDYIFMSRKEFDELVERGGFLEYAEVYGGHRYGTPAEPVEQHLAAGRVAILEIEIEGTCQVVHRYPEAVTVFIMAPSPTEQRNRLAGRRTESPEAMRERLAKADREIRQARETGVYRYFVVNETVEETVENIIRIVRENEQA
ncbi:MAG: guanylate kinase [Phycisphaerales bacterium]|nr:guanylate kinase [Phycisphaerales bacterium]